MGEPMAQANPADEPAGLAAESDVILTMLSETEASAQGNSTRGYTAIATLYERLAAQ